jgi:hypothetical protein
MNKMTKYGLILAATFLLVAKTRQSTAQSVSQLTTQLILDMQKLAEMKTILSDMYQDYAVVDKGYSTISDIAESNFNLHKGYLDGLLAISPSVKNYPKVAGIIDAENSIISEYKTSVHRWQVDGCFTTAEQGYINQTYTNIISQSGRDIDELTMTLTEDQLRMSDAERMRAIDRTYEDITGQLEFLRQFDASAAVQSMQRKKAAIELNTIQRLYGINTPLNAN